MSTILSRLIFKNPFKYGFRQKMCGRKFKPQYYVHIAYPENYESIMSFMVKTYCNFEPVIVNLGLAGRPTLGFIKLLRNQLYHGMTIFVEEMQTDRVVGAAINVNAKYSDIKNLEKLASSMDSPTKDLLNFYVFCSRVSNLWETLDVTDIFECSHLAIHPDHQGQGLARRLIADSWVLARDLDYKYFRIDCSSCYTINIAENFKWKCVHSLTYCDHFDNDKYVFSCVQDPHTMMKIYISDLRYCKTYYPPMNKQ